uniref:Uncharacterized protein n=1 Tax=Knipowitschia caucasica TaxID=637954 RepID=A0AAV2JY36_KNICA
MLAELRKFRKESGEAQKDIIESQARMEASMGEIAARMEELEQRMDSAESRSTLKSLEVNVQIDERDILEREFQNRWSTQGRRKKEEPNLTPREIRAILSGVDQDDMAGE